MSTSDKPIIVVCGVTGLQGGSVARNLLNSKKWKVKGLTRNPESSSAVQMKNLGVELVKGDLNNIDELKNAFQGAYGVFGVTNYWQPDCVNNPGREFEHGKNIVDACAQCKVQHLVWSSLDNAEKISGGKLKVDHFTNKGRVEEYARQNTAIPYKTYVQAAYYYEDLVVFNHLQFAEDRQSAELVSGIKENVKVPWFATEDYGIAVSDIFSNREEYNNKRLLVASEYLTVGEVAQILSKTLQIPVRAVVWDFNTSVKNVGREKTEMFEWFNNYGYFHDGAEQQVKNSRQKWPQMQSFEDWAKTHKDYLMKAQVGRVSA